MKGDHMLVGPGPGRSTCTHCGDVLQLGLPMNIDVWLAAMKAWLRIHRTCPAPAPTP